MKVLRLNSTGTDVKRWQRFLRGRGLMLDATGTFDSHTANATREFQTVHLLTADGVVGNQTLTKAAALGFELVNYVAEPDSGYPPPPAFGSLTPSAAQSKFGPLEFVAAPTPRNREKITITNGFADTQLQRVTIPQLIGVDGAPASGTVQIHRLAAVAFTALWVAWEVAGYLNQVLSFDGTFEPRFVRGSAAKQTLSNHAFGVAFDINVEWNAFGAEPASRGMKGCLYDLVPIANQQRFFWGGHYKTRRDGMHFEYVG
jgi:D-alanyl-D-alanine carboxypeptidase/Putative peptidoglycan binding domain